MDYSPKTDMLNAVANQPLEWKVALGELVDNALDADAKTIAISFDGGPKKSFSIDDNGVGCEHVEAIATLGDHRDHKTTKLGRYGVGATDSILWIGGVHSTVAIRSVCDGKRHSLRVDWDNLKASNWQGADPSIDAPSSGETGTRISVTPVVKTIPHGQAWDRLLEEIGYLYSPALKQGAQITVKGPKQGARPMPVNRWSLPAFEPGHIDAEIQVGQRRLRVFCGIVKEGHQNSKPGLSYFHKFRVIVPTSARGCGTFSTAKICGFVELDNTWPLAKNKTDITADWGAVEDAIFRELRPLLERAEQEGSRIESAALTAEVSRQLNAMLGPHRAKAKRDKGNSHGTAQQTGAGTPHQRARQEQPGNRFQSRSGRGAFRMDITPMGGVQIGRLNESGVLLNADNAFVKKANAEKNVLALVACCASLIGVAETYERNGQRFLRGFEPTDFGTAMGHILASDLRVDGRPVLDEVAR